MSGNKRKWLLRSGSNWWKGKTKEQKLQYCAEQCYQTPEKGSPNSYPSSDKNLPHYGFVTQGDGKEIKDCECQSISTCDDSHRINKSLQSYDIVPVS